MSRRTQTLGIAAAVIVASMGTWLFVNAVGDDAAPAGSARAGRLGSKASSSSPSPTGKPVAPARPTVRSRPPARLFAGGASAVGVLVRVCEGSACTALPQGSPATLTAPAGAPLAIAVAQAPKQAWLEVRATGEGAPAKIGLSPGTLMSWAPRTAPGRYLVTLVARFDGSEARWLFGVRVTG
jgi:hypothetical protein